MKRYLHKSRGQSTAEYAVLLAIVATALIAMQVYVKRGIQGRVRDLADQISPAHYEQGRTTSTYTTEQIGQTLQSYSGGVITTQIPEEWIDSEGNLRQGEEIRRWGSETVASDTQ